MLQEVIEQEISIFKKFSLWDALNDNCIAFCSKDTDNVPHWNLVYPKKVHYKYSILDMQDMLSFYKKNSRIGNVLAFDNDHTDCASEHIEYFIAHNPFEKNLMRNNLFIDTKLIAKKDVDLNDFSCVVASVFNFDLATHDFFLSKMKILKSIDSSCFWIIYNGDIPVGSASTFVTQNGGRFLFNVAIEKEMQNKGLGRNILHLVLQETNYPLYTYSHNSIMINKILPSLGFTRVGSGNVVPIIKYSFVE